MPRPPRQVELGDFQTPDALALQVCEHLARGPAPATIVEPTCGDGAFLAAAAQTFPGARLRGVELDPGRAQTARSRVPTAEITVADAFEHDWAAYLASQAGPVLLLGNPPWVTNAAVGALGGRNRPARRNTAGHRGYDALTGASNFDVSEWILRRLSAALPTGGRVAMLVKTSVARKLLPEVCAHGLWRIDAQRYFGAAVDAGLFVFGAGDGRTCPTYADLRASEPTSSWGVRGGRVVRDTDAYDTVALDLPPLEWRSGVKHDGAAVFELREVGDIERAVRFPLLKATDLHRDRPPSRELLCPQRALTDDPGALATTAPRAWAHLLANGARLDARKSRIYRGRPRFSVFGVGPYTFAPWKVAVSGMHQPPRFRVVGPHDERPVLFDDTCYFAPLPDEATAREVAATLDSPDARRLLAALVFPGAKRPVTKAVLARLRGL